MSGTTPPAARRISNALLLRCPAIFTAPVSDGLYVHLFHNSELNWRLEDGTPIKVIQKTDYPWKGTVQFEISPPRRRNSLFTVRKPDWSDSRPGHGEIRIPARSKAKMFAIRRRWSSGDNSRSNSIWLRKFSKPTHASSKITAAPLCNAAPSFIASNNWISKQGVAVSDLALTDVSRIRRKRFYRILRKGSARWRRRPPPRRRRHPNTPKRAVACISLPPLPRQVHQSSAYFHPVLRLGQSRPHPHASLDSNSEIVIRFRMSISCRKEVAGYFLGAGSFLFGRLSSNCKRARASAKSEFWRKAWR